MLFEREPAMLNVSPQKPTVPEISSDKSGIAEKVKRLNEDFSQSIALEQTVMQLGGDHFKNIVTEHGEAWRAHLADWSAISEEFAHSRDLPAQFAEYLTDASQRGVLFLDIMREVGNYAVEQMEGGEKLVLSAIRHIREAHGNLEPIGQA